MGSGDYPSPSLAGLSNTPDTASRESKATVLAHEISGLQDVLDKANDIVARIHNNPSPITGRDEASKQPPVSLAQLLDDGPGKLNTVRHDIMDVLQQIEDSIF